jgi:hypothetical protein
MFAKNIFLVLFLSVSMSNVLAVTKVAVFNQPGINGGGGCGTENENLISIVQSLIDGGADFTLDTSIVNFTDGSLASKLNDADFFFMTDMESPSPADTSFFPTDAHDVFKTWVSNGGVMMMTGTHGSDDTTFLNLIFDWPSGLVNVGGSTASKNTANTSGTPFEAMAATSLGTPSATQGVDGSTVPDFTVMYGTETNAAVAVIQFGSGFIVYLGFDFFDTGTSCGQNSDPWVQQIIPAAMDLSASLSATDSSKTINENSSVTFSEDDFKDSSGVTFSKIKITALPTNGTLAISGTPVAADQEILSSEYSSLSYTPDTGFSGDDGFDWEGFDGTTFSSTAFTSMEVSDNAGDINLSSSGNVTYTSTGSKPDESGGTIPVISNLSIVPTTSVPPAPTEDIPKNSLASIIDITGTSTGNPGYSTEVTFTASGENIFTGYWKYGKEVNGDVDHWYDYGTLSANGDGTGYQISNAGKTLTVYLTDNVRGDDKLDGQDEAVLDPGLPILLKKTSNSITPIPTLSFWGLLMLAALLGVFGITGLPSRTS